MTEKPSLDERVTIDLPSLSLEEVEKLLEHLAEHLPGTISYSIHENDKCIYGLIKEEEGKEIMKRPGSFRVNGTIHIGACGTSFGCKFEYLDDKYTSVAVKLRFNTFAFNRIGEFRKDEVQLWDDVRQLTGDYFL